MRARVATASALTFILALPVGAPAAVGDEYPKTGPMALAYHEADPDRWLEGPVEYLILDDERDAWKELASSDERASFIARFWERRDSEPRDRANPFKESFYERVAHANVSYRDTPFRGWRSDRGRIAVTLGLPDHVRPTGAGRGQVWTYFTFGERAEDKGFSSTSGRVEIAFVARATNRNTYTISGPQGTGIYPEYVLYALEFSRRAAVGESRAVAGPREVELEAAIGNRGGSRRRHPFLEVLDAALQTPIPRSAGGGRRDRCRNDPGRPGKSTSS